MKIRITRIGTCTQAVLQIWSKQMERLKTLAKQEQFIMYLLPTLFFAKATTMDEKSDLDCLINWTRNGEGERERKERAL